MNKCQKMWCTIQKGNKIVLNAMQYSSYELTALARKLRQGQTLIIKSARNMSRANMLAIMMATAGRVMFVM